MVAQSALWLCYRLDDRGSIAGRGTASTPTLRFSQLPFQWGPGTMFLGVKPLVLGADHSPPPSAEVKNGWTYTTTPQFFLYFFAGTRTTLCRDDSQIVRVYTVRISPRSRHPHRGSPRVYSVICENISRLSFFPFNWRNRPAWGSWYNKVKHTPRITKRWKYKFAFESRLRVVERRHIRNAASIPALGPTQSPIQWIPVSLYAGIKRPGC